MSQWKKVKIGDFLKRKRIPVVLDETAKYKLLTVRLYHKGIVLREEKLGALIKSNMFKVSKGDFILSGIDARNGAFGIVPEELDGAVVTNDFWYFDIDESIIKREYFLWLTTTPIFLDACQKASKGETQRIRLQKEAFFNYEINCPTIDYQDEFLSTIASVIDNINELKKETEKQTELVKQLRANILQDAIEGKLTADWREKHPVKKGNPDHDAQALFEKIQAEVSEAKSTKKSLASISKDEIPFEIPTGWKWVRLGEICEGFMYGTSAKSLPSGKCPVLRMGNIQNGKIDWEKLVYTNNDEEIEKYLLKQYDLLFNRTNSREMVGKTAIFESTQKTIYAGYLVRFRPINSNPYFVNIVLNSKTHREWCNEVKTDALGQSNINAEKLKNFITPLPPLAEQKEIVARVEKHLQTITQLETQIATRETLTKQLMQGLLKDAFEER